MRLLFYLFVTRDGFVLGDIEKLGRDRGELGGYIHLYRVCVENGERKRDVYFV